MSGHNKGVDIQRKVEYFRQLRNQAMNQQRKPERLTFPKFVTTARRPGARGK